MTQQSAAQEFHQVQLNEVRQQLTAAQTERNAVTERLKNMPYGTNERPPLEARLTELDARISGLNAALTSVEGQPPGSGFAYTVAPPPPFPTRVLPEDIFILSVISLVCVLLPISVAVARRVWRRG